MNQTISEDGKNMYKLDYSLRKIKSPIKLFIENDEAGLYKDGEELFAQSFDRRYLVESIEAKENYICVKVTENREENIVNWVGEEAVSFF